MRKRFIITLISFLAILSNVAALNKQSQGRLPLLKMEPHCQELRWLLLVHLLVLLLQGAASIPLRFLQAQKR